MSPSRRRRPRRRCRSAPGRPPDSPGDPADKASVLVESLPYIRRFWGKVVVVKYGGNVLATKPGEAAIDEAEALATFAEDIVLMRSVGHAPGGRPRRWAADR